jgi:hypothetical protein
LRRVSGGRRRRERYKAVWQKSREEVEGPTRDRGCSNRDDRLVQAASRGAVGGDITGAVFGPPMPPGCGVQCGGYRAPQTQRQAPPRMGAGTLSQRLRNAATGGSPVRFPAFLARAGPGAHGATTLSREVAPSLEIRTPSQYCALWKGPGRPLRRGRRGRPGRHVMGTARGLGPLSRIFPPGRAGRAPLGCSSICTRRPTRCTHDARPPDDVKKRRARPRPFRATVDTLTPVRSRCGDARGGAAPTAACAATSDTPKRRRATDSAWSEFTVPRGPNLEDRRRESHVAAAGYRDRGGDSQFNL